MTTFVVADTGPLIGLARVGCLQLLHSLYGAVSLPPAVLDELRIPEFRPGAAVLANALQDGWLRVESPEPSAALERLRLLVDPGEAEAILLGVQRGCRFLLIDDLKGRRVAKRWGVAVMGTGGVLLAAKRRGRIEAVSPLLEELRRAGYRFSAELTTGLLRRAGEE